MQQIIKKKIGKETYTYIVEGKTLWDCQQEAQKLSFNDVHKCGICGKDNLMLMSRLAKNKFKYLEIKCRSCSASLTFGQKMEDPEVFYLRKDEQKNLDWKEFELSAKQQLQHYVNHPEEDYIPNPGRD